MGGWIGWGIALEGGWRCGDVLRAIRNGIRPAQAALALYGCGRLVHASAGPCSRRVRGIMTAGRHRAQVSDKRQRQVGG